MTAPTSETSTPTFARQDTVRDTAGRLWVGRVLHHNTRDDTYVVIGLPFEGATSAQAIIVAAAELVAETTRSYSPTVEHYGLVLANYMRNARQWQDMYNSHATELERFRTQVRELALRVKADESWCDAGFNQAMDELGLDRLESEYRVYVDVTATQTVEIVVTASSEDDASDIVGNYDTTDIADQTDRYSWDVTDWDVDRVNEE